MPKWGGQFGKQNGQWKGGKSIASNGYVLLRVGTGHHLADVRGYAYEHRIVAESMIGRSLKRAEQVHHVNGNKMDNRPENLEVVPSPAHHHAFHRSEPSILRRPGEENQFITCACGCGAVFCKYDKQGRPRKFVSGHNLKELAYGR